MQTIGERLEEARKRKGISIREAAEATKIRSDYLHKFEGNQFDINLSEIYVRGFLRVYAQLLKLPADKILNDYAALGRGADSRGRQPSREVYGRMDISVASAGEKNSDPAPTVPNNNPDAGNTEQPRRAASLHRSGSSLPKIPAIDPALLFKGGLLLGAIVILGFILWGVVSLFSNKSSEGTRAQPAAVSSSQRSLSLVALKTVTVTVVNKNPDGSEGSQIFYGTLSAGQVQVVAWPGPLFIKANARENLQIEVSGKRYSTQSSGEGKVEMQAPPQ